MAKPDLTELRAEMVDLIDRASTHHKHFDATLGDEGVESFQELREALGRRFAPSTYSTSG